MKKSSLDYSKWDKMASAVDNSSDEEDESPGDASMPFSFPTMNTISKSGQLRPVPHNPNPRFGGSTYLDFHPHDDTSLMRPTYFTNPHTFVAAPHPEEKRMKPWGVNDEVTMQNLQRKMTVQFLYGFTNDMPEKQWTKVQKERKEKALNEARNLPDSEAKRARDIILDIEMIDVTPRVWRQIRVSGNMTLNAFSDKVLVPAIGLCRNYHAYYFCDQKDGAVFMPENSGAIDVMHIDMQGIYVAIDDIQYKLGDLFTDETRVLDYVYDLGDQFSFAISVSSFPPDKTGKVELLAGEMEGPPEDSNGLPNNGNGGYEEFLSYKTKMPGKYKKGLREMSSALNMKDRKNFDPFNFDINHARTRIKNALLASSSTQSGKTFSHSFRGDDNTPPSRPFSNKEMNVVSDTNMGPHTKMVETVRTGKDPKAIALCAVCGTPDHLKLCAGCKLVRYCSAECQKAHWKEHKSTCKSKK